MDRRLSNPGPAKSISRYHQCLPGKNFGLFGVEEHSGVVLIVIGFAIFMSVVGWLGFLRTVVMNTVLVMDGDLFVTVSDNCPELVCTLLRPVCLGNDM
jgi:hypothetical protein